MTIDTIAVYVLHSLLVLPVVAMATVFVAMLLDARKAAPARPHHFASLPPSTEVEAPASEPAWAMESRVMEARHELASRREQRAASPATLARAAVARARANAESVVSA